MAFPLKVKSILPHDWQIDNNLRHRYILFQLSWQVKVGEIFPILFADFQKPARVLVGAVVLRQLLSNLQCAQGVGRQWLPGDGVHHGRDGVHLPHGGDGGVVDELALVEDAVEHAPIVEAVLEEVQPAFKMAEAHLSQNQGSKWKMQMKDSRFAQIVIKCQRYVAFTVGRYRI